MKLILVSADNTISKHLHADLNPENATAIQSQQVGGAGADAVFLPTVASERLGGYPVPNGAMVIETSDSAFPRIVSGGTLANPSDYATNLRVVLRALAKAVSVYNQENPSKAICSVEVQDQSFEISKDNVHQAAGIINEVLSKVP